MVQVELPRHAQHESILADRVVRTSNSIAKPDEETKSHDDDVDDDDGGDGGGGTQHGLRAERLQDAEASLDGDDGGQDLGNPTKAVQSRHVVVCQETLQWTVPVIVTKAKLLY